MIGVFGFSGCFGERRVHEPARGAHKEQNGEIEASATEQRDAGPSPESGPDSAPDAPASSPLPEEEEDRRDFLSMRLGIGAMLFLGQERLTGFGLMLDIATLPPLSVGGLYLRPAVGFTLDFRLPEPARTHLTTGLGVGWRNRIFTVGYEAQLMIGGSQGQIEVGLLNGLTFGAAIFNVHIFYGTMWREGALNHDLRLMVSADVGAMIWRLIR